MSWAMTYEIEKSVPMPPRLPRETIAKMEVGDSFFVPKEDLASITAISGAAGNWSRSRTGGKIKFATRQLTENKVFGVRCWRIK